MFLYISSIDKEGKKKPSNMLTMVNLQAAWRFCFAIKRKQPGLSEVDETDNP